MGDQAFGTPEGYHRSVDIVRGGSTVNLRWWRGLRSGEKKGENFRRSFRMWG